MSQLGVTRVVVDPLECEANAVCIGVAPEVFDLDDEDRLHVLVDQVPPGQLERVREAVSLCPKRALSLRED